MCQQPRARSTDEAQARPRPGPSIMMRLTLSYFQDALPRRSSTIPFHLSVACSTGNAGAALFGSKRHPPLLFNPRDMSMQDVRCGNMHWHRTWLPPKQWMPFLFTCCCLALDILQLNSQSIFCCCRSSLSR
jgi:hypothetical protein